MHPWRSTHLKFLCIRLIDLALVLGHQSTTVELLCRSDQPLYGYQSLLQIYYITLEPSTHILGRPFVRCQDNTLQQLDACQATLLARGDHLGEHETVDFLIAAAFFDSLVFATVSLSES